MILLRTSLLQRGSLNFFKTSEVVTRSITSFANRAKKLEATAPPELDSSLHMEDKRALRAPVDPVPPHLLGTIGMLRECIAKQDYDAGWSAFEETQDVHVVLLGTVLNLCVKAHWWDRAWKIWSDFPLGSKSVVHYSTMIDLCAQVRREGAAESLFEEMPQVQVQPNLITYNSLLKTYSMTGNKAKAIETFKSVPAAVFEEAGTRTKQIYFQSVMQACGREGDYAQAREIFMEMMQAGIQPQIPHYVALLTACARAVDAETAEGVFKSMVGAGLKPNLQSYTILISCNQYNKTRCLEIIEEMKLRGIEPSSLTNLELLGAYVNSRDGDGARKLLESADFGVWRSNRKFARLAEEARDLT